MFKVKTKTPVDEKLESNQKKSLGWVKTPTTKAPKAKSEPIPMDVLKGLEANFKSSVKNTGDPQKSRNPSPKLNAAKFAEFDEGGSAGSPPAYNPAYSRMQLAQSEEPALPDNSKAYNAINTRFDLIRNRTSQDANTFKQEQDEAIQRKAAALGATGSGAFIKLGQQASERGEQAKVDALAGVESERASSLAQQDELQAQRAFQRGERIGSQNFAAREADMGRAFQSGETAAARGFEKQLFDLSQEFQKKALASENAQFMDSMNMAAKQLALDEKISQFNMKMAKKAGKGGGGITGAGNWQNYSTLHVLDRWTGGGMFDDGGGFSF